MILKTIRALLLADVSVSALAGDRIYLFSPPQPAEFPLITYQKISEVLNGTILTAESRVQFDCYGKTYTAADELAAAVRAALLNRTAAGTEEDILSIAHTNTLDLSDPETRLYRITVDMSIVWRPRK